MANYCISPSHYHTIHFCLEPQLTIYGSLNNLNIRKTQMTPCFMSLSVNTCHHTSPYNLTTQTLLSRKVATFSFSPICSFRSTSYDHLTTILDRLWPWAVRLNLIVRLGTTLWEGVIILICQGLLNLPVANHFNSPSHYHTFLSWAASINRVRSGAGASCFVWLQPIGKSFPLLHLKSVKPVGSSQRRVRLEITQFKETPWLS